MSDKINWDDFTPADPSIQKAKPKPVDWSSFTPEQPKTAAGDIARSLKSGVQQLPGIVTGIADIPTALAFGARPFTKAADAIGEATGFQPGKWAKETQYSEGYNDSKKAVDEAWKGVEGVVSDPTKNWTDVAKKAGQDAGSIAAEYLKNPLYTANQVVESLPAMFAGGAVSKGLMTAGRVAGAGLTAEAIASGAMGPTRNALPGYLERAVGEKMAAPIAGGVGEGVMQAGQQMEEGKDNPDQRKNAIAALVSGAGNALISMGAGRLANKLGFETAETAMAKAGDGKVATGLGAAKRIGGGVASEGLLQELPQSVQEQNWQNWAEGKPLMEGALRAGVEGALAGGIMGAGANIHPGSPAQTPPPPAPENNGADGWTTSPGASDGTPPTEPPPTGPLGAKFTPEWTTELGAAPAKQPGIDMPREIDTGALAIKPSEAMGLAPTAGPSLANAAILSVDSGIHQAATESADPYNAPLSALGQELSRTNQRLRQEADALGLDTEGLHGDAARMTDGKSHEDYLMAANDQLRKAMKAAKEIPYDGQRSGSDDPAPGGEAKGPDAQAGKASTGNAAGPVGAGAVRPATDRVGEHGQRPAGTDGGSLPGAVAAPTRDQAIAKASDAAGKVLASGGTDADANRAATDSLIDQMAATPGIAIAQDVPAAVKAAKAKPPANNNAQTTPSAPISPTAGLPAAGPTAVQADGVKGKQEFQIGGKDPHTRTYDHRSDGRLVRTITYPDGQSATETLVTNKKGDELWVSNDRYGKAEFYPVQLSLDEAETATREDMADKPLSSKPQPQGALSNVSKSAELGTQASQAPSAQGAPKVGEEVVPAVPAGNAGNAGNAGKTPSAQGSAAAVGDTSAPTGSVALASPEKQKALDRIASGKAWFGSGPKAQQFIAQNGLKDTHTVKKTSATRFDVVEVETKTSNISGSQSVGSSGTQSELPKSADNSGSTDAKLVADLASGEPFSEKRGNKISTDVLAAMQRHMLRISQNPKILNAVVELIPVDVMDVLSRQQLTPDVLFSNPTMLTNGRIGSDGNHSVSIPIDASASIMRAVALVTAKNLSLFERGDTARLPVNHLSANNTREVGAGLGGVVDAGTGSGGMPGAARSTAKNIGSPVDKGWVSGDAGATSDASNSNFSSHGDDVSSEQAKKQIQSKKGNKSGTTTYQAQQAEAQRPQEQPAAAGPVAGAPLPNATAPEHIAGGDEGGVSVDEMRQIAQELRGGIDAGDEAGVTHINDAPAKGEVVRLADKVKVYHKDHGWMTPAQAKAEIAKWKENARKQGQTHANADKVVLSLFDLSGEWSKPWAEAGYQVYTFDIQDDPNMGDVNNFSTEFFSDWFGAFEGQDVHAILAACPCTDFAVSGARHFAAKDADGRTVASIRLVKQTMAAIEFFKPAVWALENPVGRIESLTGLPPWRLSFDPNHLGDPYTKKTLIWGRFNADLPIAPVEPTEGSKMHDKFGGKSQKTKNARSVTPEGFAYGFFQANNAIDHPLMTVANKYDRLDKAAVKAALDAGITPTEIDRIVEDFYYQDLDDDAANEALRKAAADKAPATVPAAAANPKIKAAFQAKSLQKAMAAAGWTAEVGGAGNTIWTKQANKDRYTAILTPETGSMEITVLVDTVDTQIASFSISDPKAAATAANKAVADDVAESAPATSNPKIKADTDEKTDLDAQLAAVNDELDRQGAVQNANTRARRDAIRKQIAERDFPEIFEAVDGDISTAEDLNRAFQYAGDEPKAKTVERILKKRGVTPEYQKRWSERLLEGQQAGTKPESVVKVPEAIGTAIQEQMEKQKRRVMRRRSEESAPGLNLEQKAAAQTKTKAAEATLRAMRTSIFDAEDAAVKAVETGKASEFEKHADLFPAANDAIRAMLGQNDELDAEMQANEAGLTAQTRADDVKKLVDAAKKQEKEPAPGTRINGLAEPTAEQIAAIGDITIEVPTETGTAKMTVNAAKALASIDERLEALEMVQRCLA